MLCQLIDVNLLVQPAALHWHNYTELQKCM